MKHHSSRRRQAGQSSMEFLIVCAMLALVLGVGMVDNKSALKQLLGAFTTAYRNFSYAISLPG
ncbi:hypothetical protein ACFOLJ_27825 [Rugamonas sp. CCM 8940]|uniref:hypothetical protein n=1 Tax=Rugamonas sp. CCM 8940 TaxID=2765359 RepID=UPI0018F2BB1A|nr:hypothetical protein [Rugamonas sp. CCM 8940]MBJ7311281.1 hypothetical protein [Rugamonas sp. CCM 8940]